MELTPEKIKKEPCLFDYIVDTICANEKISLEEINTNTRRAEVNYARQLIMYFAYELKCGTLKTIGRRLNRDHATVIHAFKAIKDRYETDVIRRAEIDSYREKLSGVAKLVSVGEYLMEELKVVQARFAETGKEYVNLQLALNNFKDEVNKIINQT